MNTLDGRLSSGGKRGEILLVDDSPSALSLLSNLLTEAGYRVREAPSGELALMTLSIRLPDLVLLDVRMPEMDGFEVCRRIKANPLTQAVSVIFLSAQDDTADRVQGLEVGAIDFIAKAFPPAEVFARIDTHVALSRTRKALEMERAHLENRVRERTEQLRQERALLQNVVDSGPDWIDVTDRQHRYLMVNRNMALALGYVNSADFIGKYSCKSGPCDTCPIIAAAGVCDCHNDQKSVFAGKTIHQLKDSVVLPDGRALIFETHKTPLHDANGDIYGVLCYRRDITQRIKMEADAKVLERTLWQAKKMEAVGQLTGGIAHDFNHLLSLILGYAEFAKTVLATGKTEKLNDYLSEILKAATEGQIVVGQLLAFSRTDEYAAEAIDIGPILTEVVGSLHELASASINLDLAIDPSLPSAFIKAIQVKQIVTNLLLNSRDALGETGSIEVRLQRNNIPHQQTCVSCRKSFHGDHIVLSVADTGPGIPQEIIDNIFDPFFTTKDVGKGSGLGLPMVHGIVHSAGGHIQLETSASHGTKFMIWIPVQAGA